MIVCNACQLLATNLPFCHSRVLEWRLARLRSFECDSTRSKLELLIPSCQVHVSVVIMKASWKGRKWVLYCILQHNRVLVLFSFLLVLEFKTNEIEPDFRFNLVGLGVNM